jgi:hypothetical protein
MLLITIYRRPQPGNKVAMGYVEYLGLKGRKKISNDDIRIKAKTGRTLLYKLLKNTKL